MQLEHVIPRMAAGSFVLIFLVFPVPVSFASITAAETGRSHQLLGTFFYPWYGHYNHWNLSGYRPPISWASKYLPSVFDTNDSGRALYDSNDTTVILWQLGKMKSAGLDFVISSWWGRGTYDDQVLRKIILEVMPRNDNPFHELKWSIVYEKVRFANPSMEEIVRDLQYLKATFGISSNILRINGKMVLFVAGTPTDQGDYVEKMEQCCKTSRRYFPHLESLPRKFRASPRSRRLVSIRTCKPNPIRRLLLGLCITWLLDVQRVGAQIESGTRASSLQLCNACENRMFISR